MSDLIFTDAQQAAGFVTPALYRTHAAVLQTKYPSFDYSGLVPINTDGDMWDIGTLVYSGDIVLATEEGAPWVKYIHGDYGKGTWTYLGGHDPEDPQHAIGNPPTDLSLHKSSPGYRLILNNVLFPAAKKKPLKT